MPSVATNIYNPSLADGRARLRHSVIRRVASSVSATAAQRDWSGKLIPVLSHVDTEFLAVRIGLIREASMAIPGYRADLSGRKTKFSIFSERDEPIFMINILSWWL